MKRSLLIALPALGALVAYSAGQATNRDALTMARDAALQAAQGQKIGGSVNVMAVWGGEERDKFLATLKPFEEATGIKVEYEGTRDINAVLTTRIAGGNPPEIAGIPSLSLLEDWSAKGKLVDLDNIIGASTLKNNFSSGWLNLGSYKDKTFGMFFSASLKGLIWYNTKTYTGPKAPRSWAELSAWTRAMAAKGTTPWCVGVESGAASGWAGTDWIENILLRQSGPKKYDDWYNGKLAWTSTEVKKAFQAFGAIVTNPKMVYGGPITVLSTNFGDAATPMFSAKPGCFLHHQATFISSFFEKNTPGIKAGTDFNFFGFPDINPQFAGSVEASGDMFGVFKETPQSKALIKYLSSSEAQAFRANLGGVLAANKTVPTSVYPDVVSQGAAKILANAKNVRFDASDLMPGKMNDAFWKAILEYTQKPQSLNAVLAKLDAVRLESY